MSKRILDFSLVADLDRPRVFFALPSDLEAALSRFPEVAARSYAAVRFAYMIETSREHLSVPDERELALREAYFRASLTEFASLEDAADRDFRHLSLGTPPKMRDSKNPLVHLFRELRNLNVHLTKSDLARSMRPAIWDTPHGPIEFDYTLWLIPDLTVSLFSAGANTKYFEASDIIKLVNWFNLEQAQWGTPHMILLAIRAFCEEVLQVAEVDDH